MNVPGFFNSTDPWRPVFRTWEREELERYPETVRELPRDARRGRPFTPAKGKKKNLSPLEAVRVRTEPYSEFNGHRRR